MMVNFSSLIDKLNAVVRLKPTQYNKLLFLDSKKWRNLAVRG